ncbi:hypothetical protein [Crocosphaera sp. XPORK-15E]|uniref:hypothetical protein n=1 Tax=Crocosphaera sp. XPORK-15E TaxID=3110247 RepID=UPI002B1FF804|nr:hypothetical protein [Crocosphaera sp. XPORK-15E]MEA5534543.1 hypothetical protein [Crocosphaera sp. XPORK-15E]
MGILDLWDISREDLNQLIETNPSLQRSHLIASLIPVTFPPKPPFYLDIIPLLESHINQE